MLQTTPWYQPTESKDEAEIAENKVARASALFNETAQIESRQSTWYELNLWNSTLFSNRETVGFRWGEIEAGQELSPVNLRTENLIEQIGESLMSKAASSPLRPSLVPRGMNLDVEAAVREADDFVFAMWRETESEEVAIKMFFDAYLAGIGCARPVYNKKTKTLHVESVFFDCLVIDNRECANRGMPRTYRIRQVVPRSAVESRYNVTLTQKPRHYVDYRAVADDWVVLIEAWRLPDERGKGGWHMVSCCDQTLIDERYTEDWVPLVFFHWSDLVNGFFGKGGVEQLVPFQNRHDDLNEAIELCQDIVCRPRLLLNANSMIDVNQWDNVAGRMLLWSGIEPKPFEWRTNLVDLYQERERNGARAKAHVGISEQFSGAELADGVRLDSSAGVREFHNMEDRRNLRRWERYQAARLRLAKLCIKVLAAEKGAESYSPVLNVGGSSTKAIPFEALKTLADDSYSWSMEAVPLATMSPAARRELVRDWSSRGLIDADEARRMEGNPNLEREETLEMASKEDIDLRHIKILQEGGYEAPTELTNCTYGIKKVTQNYHRLRRYPEVKKAVIENHIRWIVQAVSIQQAAVAPPTPTPFSPTQGMPGTNASNGPSPIYMNGGQAPPQ